MDEAGKKKDKMNSFSVPLGLFDYINPVCYAVTTATLAFCLCGAMPLPLFILFAAGAVLSLIFGFTIPTVKLLVGLGKMSFKMPVNLVFYVNTGIFLSGLALLGYVVSVKPLTAVIAVLLIAALLGLIWKKTKKFNTVAVLTGAAGYLMIYSSLIVLSARAGSVFPIVLYAFAIGLFFFLCAVGIGSDLKKPKVYWAIEIANVLCQFSVALATVILLFF